MMIWVIEPHDPLIVRDGRPFNPTPGARAVSLPFPLPSTVIGALRTRAGSDTNGIFDQTRVDEVLALGMHGPFLVEIEQDQQLKWLVPAPADALITKDIPHCLPLVPFRIGTDEQTDVQDLAMLVAPKEPTPAKADPQAPRFWRWHHFREWLVQPKSMLIPTDLGIRELLSDQRVHVRVSAESQAADEGGLFITRGLEFTTKQQGYSLAVSRLGLALATDAPIQSGLGLLGGERRMVAWRSTAAQLPQPPDGLIDRIVEQQQCRLVLLTPALFMDGYRPNTLLRESDGVKAELMAAAVGRPQIATGWDYATQKAKPSRRMAPAGSVYWLTLNGSKAAIRDWATRHWMQSISDAEQDRKDGFGLAVLGTWPKES